MLKRKKRIIAKVMATTMLATTLASTFAVEANAQEPRSSVTSSKISGDDRYKTAVEISKNYSSTSKHAVVVNGQKGIVDALTATPYASLKKAPILMTQNNKLNEDTKKELTRRGIKTVDIIGGTASVSDSVKAEIEKMGITVNRIAGNSKYETSLKVAKEVDKISNISKIAVANGEVLADAVSVAAPAAQNKMPIILAHPSKGLDDATKTYIKGEGISTSYVIGGTSSVSNSTQNSLPGTKKRLEGTGRQETNAKVVKEFYDTTSHDNIYVTKSGQVNKADEIADALAVGVLAAHNQDPVLIVGKNLAGEQKTLLEGKDFDKITEVGNGIPTASIQAIKDTQSSVKNVTTVAALNSALSNAKDGDVINFKPSSTVSESITLSTSKNVTVNLDGTHSGNVTVNMASGNVNINGNITGKVSVDAVKTINIKSGVTVKHLEIKSSANKANIVNKGTVTTFDVLASGVVISGSGNITALNPQGDTDFSGVTGEIGNMDTSKPVSQVIATNVKQVVVNFNKPVDKSSVINGEKLASGINIAGPTITSSDCTAELSENRMTLTITAKKGEKFNGTYRIDINNVNSNGVQLDNYSTTFKADDKTAPTVASTTFNQNDDTFEVTLSEPVDSLDGLVLRVNNKPISKPAITAPTKKIVFKRPSGDVSLNSTVDVYMAGVKDAKGNIMVPYNGRVSTTNSNISVSSVTQKSDDEIKLVFNKKLSTGSNNDLIAKKGIEIYKMNNSAQGDKINIREIKLDSSDDTGKSYIIKIDNILVSESKDSQRIALKIVKYKEGDKDVIYEDVTGNKISESTNQLTLNKDKVNPTVTSVAISSDKTGIEVTMSEDIELNTNLQQKVRLRMNGANVNSVSVRKKSDRVLSITTTDTVAMEDGKLRAGTYQVRLENAIVKDLNGNDSKEYNSANLVITEGSLPALDITSILNGAEDNTFEVQSPGGQKFTFDSLSYQNFKLDGKVIPKESDVYFKGAGHGTIIVKLPTEDSVNLTGTGVLEASGLKLESGRSLNGKTATINLTDNTAPSLISAKAIISNKNDDKVQLKLTFDENLNEISGSDVSIISDELIIKRGSGSSEKVYNWGVSTNPQDTTADNAIYSVNGKELTITITKGDNSNLLDVFAATRSSEISIETKASQSTNIKDANNVNARVGNKVNTNSLSEEIK